MAAMTTPGKRAHMLVPQRDDPREDGPSLADERATLVELLRCQGETLKLKCAGFDAADLAANGRIGQ